jgi:carbonic anhydrase
VRNFARDVSGYETVVKQLDLANTFVIGHDCGGARAQYDLAVAGAELSRQHVYYHLNKIQAFVKKFVS